MTVRFPALQRAIPTVHPNVHFEHLDEQLEYTLESRIFTAFQTNPQITYTELETMLGALGSSLHRAIQKLTDDGNVKSVGLPHFEDSFVALKEGRADYAVMPIENSFTGAIRQVYELLMKYECFMVGETTVPIEHCLAAVPGATLADIDSVYSHEQGLFQCEKFLDQYPDWKRYPYADTAGSAKMVAETGDIHKAAICSLRAAEIYNLKVLKPSIQTKKNNTTRFVVVAPRMELREGRNKLCLAFVVKHQGDDLHKVLSIFANHSLKLIHIESRPVTEGNWEYMYFLELTGNLTDPGMEEIMLSVEKATSKFRVFGNYVSNL